jgi:hypothetical protein
MQAHLVSLPLELSLRRYSAVALDEIRTDHNVGGSLTFEIAFGWVVLDGETSGIAGQQRGFRVVEEVSDDVVNVVNLIFIV